MNNNRKLYIYLSINYSFACPDDTKYRNHKQKQQKKIKNKSKSKTKYQISAHHLTSKHQHPNFQQLSHTYLLDLNNMYFTRSDIDYIYMYILYYYQFLNNPNFPNFQNPNPNKHLKKYMKPDFISTSDGWPSMTTWQENQKYRLDRLKQQRQRMEKMKSVVEQYSRIISQLENKNNALQKENQQMRAVNQQKDKCMIENYTLNQKYIKVCEDLDRQKKLKQSYEITVDSLKKQLADLQLAKMYAPTPSLRSQMEVDYQMLRGLYEELKEEMYFLHTQNLSLKQALKNQQSINYSRNQQFKPGMIRVCSNTNLRSPLPLTPKYTPIPNNQLSRNQLSSYNLNQPLKLNLFQKQSKSYIPTPSHRYPISTTTKLLNSTKDCHQTQIQKLLRQQIRKQDDLIKQFKTNESKQLQLINSLQTQKVKMCLCHKYGKSQRGTLISKRDDIGSFNYQIGRN